MVGFVGVQTDGSRGGEGRSELGDDNMDVFERGLFLKAVYAKASY